MLGLPYAWDAGGGASPAHWSERPGLQVLDPNPRLRISPTALCTEGTRAGLASYTGRAKAVAVLQAGYAALLHCIALEFSGHFKECIRARGEYRA